MNKTKSVAHILILVICLLTGGTPLSGVVAQETSTDSASAESSETSEMALDAAIEMISIQQEFCTTDDGEWIHEPVEVERGEGEDLEQEVIRCDEIYLESYHMTDVTEENASQKFEEVVSACEFSSQKQIDLANALEKQGLVEDIENVLSADICKSKGEDFSQCLTEVMCNVRSTVPGLNTAIDYLSSGNSACGDHTTQDGCIGQFFKGVWDDLVANVDGLMAIPGLAWEGTKAAAGAAWNGVTSLFSDTEEVEDTTSTQAIRLANEEPGFFQRFKEDPAKTLVETFKNMFDTVGNYVSQALGNNFGCIDWVANPESDSEECEEPYVSWGCASCSQKMNMACGTMGLLGGEALVALLTGGTVNIASKIGRSANLAGKAARMASKVPGAGLAGRAGRLSARVVDLGLRVPVSIIRAPGGMAIRIRDKLFPLNAAQQSRLRQVLRGTATGVAETANAPKRYMDLLDKMYVMGRGASVPNGTALLRTARAAKNGRHLSSETDDVISNARMSQDSETQALGSALSRNRKEYREKLEEFQRLTSRASRNPTAEMDERVAEAARAIRNLDNRKQELLGNLAQRRDIQEMQRLTEGGVQGVNNNEFLALRSNQNTDRAQDAAALNPVGARGDTVQVQLQAGQSSTPPVATGRVIDETPEGLLLGNDNVPDGVFIPRSRITGSSNINNVAQNARTASLSQGNTIRFKTNQGDDLAGEVVQINDKSFVIQNGSGRQTVRMRDIQHNSIRVGSAQHRLAVRRANRFMRNANPLDDESTSVLSSARLSSDPETRNLANSLSQTRQEYQRKLNELEDLVGQARNNPNAALRERVANKTQELRRLKSQREQMVRDLSQRSDVQDLQRLADGGLNGVRSEDFTNPTANQNVDAAQDSAALNQVGAQGDPVQVTLQSGSSGNPQVITGRVVRETPDGVVLANDNLPDGALIPHSRIHSSSNLNNIRQNRRTASMRSGDRVRARNNRGDDVDGEVVQTSDKSLTVRNGDRVQTVRTRDLDMASIRATAQENGNRLLTFASMGRSRLTNLMATLSRTKKPFSILKKDGSRVRGEYYTMDGDDIFIKKPNGEIQKVPHSSIHRLVLSAKFLDRLGENYTLDEEEESDSVDDADEDASSTDSQEDSTDSDDETETSDTDGDEQEDSSDSTSDTEEESQRDPAVDLPPFDSSIQGTNHSIPGGKPLVPPQPPMQRPPKVYLMQGFP